MCEIENKVAGIALGERVLMNARAFGRAQFGPDVVVAQQNRIVARRRYFVSMAETRTVAFARILPSPRNRLHWPGPGH